MEKSLRCPAWVLFGASLILVCAILLCSAEVRGQGSTAPNQAPNQTAQALASNIQLLEFVTQAKLTPDERAQVAREVATYMKSAPQKVIHRDGLISTTLTNAARFPKDAPRLRELWRYEIAADVPHDDIEYIVVEKYDPTVVLDKAHQRIVTEETLTALRGCTEWLAPNLHKAPPGPDFIAGERAYLRSGYWHMGEDEQDAYAHVARNCAHDPDFFHGIVAAQRIQFFANNAKAVTDTTTEAKDAALISRIVYNILLRRAGGGAAMQGRVFDYMVQQSLLQQQLQRTVIRNPSLPPPN